MRSPLVNRTSPHPLWLAGLSALTVGSVIHALAPTTAAAWPIAALVGALTLQMIGLAALRLRAELPRRGGRAARLCERLVMIAVVLSSELALALIAQRAPVVVVTPLAAVALVGLLLTLVLRRAAPAAEAVGGLPAAALPLLQRWCRYTEYRPKIVAFYERQQARCAPGRRPAHAAWLSSNYAAELRSLDSRRAAALGAIHATLVGEDRAGQAARALQVAADGRLPLSPDLISLAGCPTGTDFPAADRLPFQALAHLVAGDARQGEQLRRYAAQVGDEPPDTAVLTPAMRWFLQTICANSGLPRCASCGAFAGDALCAACGAAPAAARRPDAPRWQAPPAVLSGATMVVADISH